MKRMSHFCVVLTLIATTIASPMENPCENIDKITFPGDPLTTLRTVEWNNKTILCYPDGTMAMNPNKPPSDTNIVDLPPRFGKFDGFQWKKTRPISNILDFMAKLHVFTEFPTHRPMRPLAPTKSPAAPEMLIRTDFKDYPLDLIKQLVEKEGDNSNLLFSSDAVETDVRTRGGVGSNDVFEMCQTMSETIYPTQGQTQSQTWLWIVNTPEKKQGVRVSKCMGVDAPCEFASLFPNRYITRCKQQYVYRELTALAADNQTLVKERFSFPACCSCEVEKVDGPRN